MSKLKPTPLGDLNEDVKDFVLHNKHKIDKTLPILECQEEIVKAIKDDSVQVITIQSPTGSGKTLCVPVLISQMKLKVIVSIPTILGTHGIYDFQYKNVFDKKDIGYSCNREVYYDEDTKITYVTTQHMFNSLLKIFKDRIDERVFIIDESHHSGEETFSTSNLALAALKRGYIKKVIFMSATLCNKEFEGFVCKNIVSKGRLYKIDTFWGNDRIDLKGKEVITKVIDKVYKIIEEHKNNPRTGILVFLPGSGEIEETADIFYNRREYNNNIVVFSLYSAHNDEYFEVLNEPIVKGRTIVVFSTNAAESSITIPYIDTVVDTGTQKTIYETDISSRVLNLGKISKDKSIQRMGRAGRQGPGKFYPLYSKEEFDSLKDTELSDFERLMPYKSVLSALNISLNVKEIFEISEKKYDVMMSKLNKLELVKNNKTTRLGNIISKKDMSIEYSLIIEETRNTKNNMINLLTVIIISMIEEGDKGFYYWIPAGFRSGIKKREYVAEKFKDFSGENDLITLINIFSDMFHCPKKTSSHKPHENNSIKEWAQKNSLNNEQLKKVRKTFTRIMYDLYGDVGNCRWEDYIYQIMNKYNKSDEFRDYEIKHFCTIEMYMAKIYEKFERVFYNSILHDPVYDNRGLRYTSYKDEIQYRVDTVGIYSDFSNSYIPKEVVALKCFGIEAGSVIYICSVVFPTFKDFTEHKDREKENIKRFEQEFDEKNKYESDSDSDSDSFYGVD